MPDEAFASNIFEWTSDVATLIAERGAPPWKRRLTLPAYRVVDAARYAGISSETVRNWERAAWNAPSIVTGREKGVSLSYLQLVELAFVAQLRRAGLSIKKIQAARDYMRAAFTSEFPFAEHRFKTDGQDIILQYNQLVADQPEEKLLIANKSGQLAWKSILGPKFTEFEYEADLAVRWHPRGNASPVFIDPRISFGAPTVKGVATWAIRGRYDGGESIEDIAEDFSITPHEVDDALKFEGINLSELKAWS